MVFPLPSTRTSVTRPTDTPRNRTGLEISSPLTFSVVYVTMLITARLLICWTKNSPVARMMATPTTTKRPSRA
jgi:hypothetical protein